MRLVVIVIAILPLLREIASDVRRKMNQILPQNGCIGQASLVAHSWDMHLDAHQHFWRYNPGHQVWMTDEMAVLRRDHPPAELKLLLQSIRFDGIFGVQAQQNPFNL